MNNILNNVQTMDPDNLEQTATWVGKVLNKVLEKKVGVLNNVLNNLLF